MNFSDSWSTNTSMSISHAKTSVATRWLLYSWNKSGSCTYLYTPYNNYIL